MASSTQSSLFTSLTYNDTITQQIIASGGTVVFTKDNVILASEISEEEYRDLLKSPYIDKIDILPLKRYANTGVQYVIDTSGTSGSSGTSGTSGTQ